MREDFTSVFPGIYFTLDLPIKIGPNDYNDQLFLGLNTNLTYVVFVHDPEYKPSCDTSCNKKVYNTHKDPVTLYRL